MKIRPPATPPQDAEAGCVGKVRFCSPRLARRAARRKPGREVYRCRICGGWHVGHAKHD